MKIMHTADWHLGLITEGKCRKEEQTKILDEICLIADQKNVDVVLICGDLFCGINTPAYADQMLANALLRLSKNGNRAIIAIAGNNDETERFVATKEFALTKNIYLLNDLSTDFNEDFVCKKAKFF